MLSVEKRKGDLVVRLPETSITTPRAACALRWMKRWGKTRTFAG